MVTVLDVLRGASEFLEKKQIESPRLNAEHLLAHVMGKKRIELYMEFDRPLEEDVRGPMRELIRARGEGRPLQHLLGSVEFLGREFLSDGRALIPRPETEQLVELVLARLPPGELSLLDVGTGSGIIAISLALERPDCRVHAVDISPEALTLAKENANRLASAPEFHLADLLPPMDQRWDAVIANLPYIPSQDIPTLSREVKHDPLGALDGGPDGLHIIRDLLVKLPSTFKPGGLLALEIGSGQHESLLPVLAANNFRDIEALADYQGHIRFLIAKYG